MSQPSSSNNTNVLINLDQINHLDFNVSCDYQECDAVATYRLICPACSMFEFMCSPHAMDAIQAPKGSWIVFDRSCKHRVDMFDCGKEPI